MSFRSVRLPAVALTLLAAVAPSAARAQAVRIEAVPAELTVRRGAAAELTVRVLDASGRAVTMPLRVGGPRAALGVEPAGDGRWTVTGLEVGSHEVVIAAAPADGSEPTVLRVPVRVEWPPVARLEIAAGAGRVYAATRVPHRARVLLEDGGERPGAPVAWTSSDESVAVVDRFGVVRAHRPGRVRITAQFEGVGASIDHDVAPLRLASLEITGGDERIRTGDVQTLRAVARTDDGTTLDDVAVTWSHAYTPDDSIRAPQAPAQLDDGRFVASVPGVHTVFATAGGVQAEKSFSVVKRDVVRKVDVVGQGREQRVFTTDFWIFRGVDGRDYALTGSKMGDGITFVWDVTDPTNIVKTDSIQVDARTTNDVKVSPDGRWAAISREGASNRRNGVVLLDLSDPAHPVVASIYDDGLTGGVHNMFATENHLFALSAGDKYVILDVTDLRAPKYVSEYDHPDSRVHDVWVHDGLAYSAEWGTGVVVVDVGNGRWGGSIEKPTFVTSFPLPTGSTHAVFPYYQASTGRFLLFVGDERVQREGLAWEGTGPDHREKYDPATGRGGYPRATSGYIQVVDFTDPEAPAMIARYEVPEFGTHNLWVEDDILYQAYYEGGVRMVDVSGDLMGNLYLQDREIAVFKAHDPVGYIPNSPGAWSVMPYKGRIFFSDINSGLWSIRLAPRERPVS